MSNTVSAAATGFNSAVMQLKKRSASGRPRGRRAQRAIPQAAPLVEAPEVPLTRRAAKKALRAGFRPELQGLRALAVMMVVTYHIWFGRVSGGVDIFLLISAFLLSLSFTRKAEAGQPAALFSYWLHTFSRLIPAAALVIGATLAGTRYLLPRDRWNEIIEQSYAAAGYFQNWVLAGDAVDYYAADHSVASPLQHFWSLSIQGQVFIAWPLLFALAGLTAKAFGWKFRAVAAALFGAVFTSSFIFSVWQTSHAQSYAYFDTRARLWEFALGTLLALVVPYLKLPRKAAVAAGWLGIVAMLSAGFVLDVQGLFPGYAALWPLLSSVLVIVAGQTGSPYGVDRILSSKILVRLGDISYPLYLWHWPILVGYLIYRGRDSAGVFDGAAIIGVSLVLAWLTSTVLERPLKKFSARGVLASLAVIAVFAGAAAGPASFWKSELTAEAAALAAQADRNNPGAFILLDAYSETPDPGAPVLPENATADWASPGQKCTGDIVPSSERVAKMCLMNTVEGTAAKTILVLGSSHSQQWMGALLETAEKHNYQVVSAWLGGCTYGAQDPSHTGWCNSYNAEATAYALELKPDLLFTVGTAAQPETNQEIPAPGLIEAANTLERAGIKVVGVRDNPRFSFNMFECQRDKGPAACAAPLEEKLNPVSPAAELNAKAPGMGFIDMTDMICPDGTCSPVIGNVYVYMDTNHLSRTYTKSTAPVFDERFLAATGWV